MTDYSEISENTRVIDYGKSKIIMKRIDPYGFIKINLSQGSVPEELTGHYTSFDDAKKRVIRYLERKRRVYKEVE